MGSGSNRLAYGLRIFTMGVISVVSGYKKKVKKEKNSVVGSWHGTPFKSLSTASEGRAVVANTRAYDETEQSQNER